MKTDPMLMLVMMLFAFALLFGASQAMLHDTLKAERGYSCPDETAWMQRGVASEWIKTALETPR